MVSRMEPTLLISHLYVHSETHVAYSGIIASWSSEVTVPAFDDGGVKTACFISHEKRLVMCLIVDLQTFPGLVVHLSAVACRLRRHWQGVKRVERH